MEGWDIRNVFTSHSLAVLGLLLAGLALIGLVHVSLRGAVAV